jgi:hypothetical protein
MSATCALQWCAAAHAAGLATIWFGFGAFVPIRATDMAKAATERTRTVVVVSIFVGFLF